MHNLAPYQSLIQHLLQVLVRVSQDTILAMGERMLANKKHAWMDTSLFVSPSILDNGFWVGCQMDLTEVYRKVHFATDTEEAA
jgi:hypothetical protein